MSKFIEGWYELQQQCVEVNEKVWGPYSDFIDSNDVKGRKLLQIVGEVVETQDALRIGNPMSEKITGFTCEEEEMADVVLRAMDYSHANRLRIAEAMVAKMEYNKTRPHRHGGKLF